MRLCYFDDFRLGVVNGTNVVDVTSVVSDIPPHRPACTNHRGLSSLHDGDKVEIEVETLGRLTIKVSDALKRTWPRETRLERGEAGLKGPSQQLTGKYASGA